MMGTSVSKGLMSIFKSSLFVYLFQLLLFVYHCDILNITDIVVSNSERVQQEGSI